MPRLRKIILNNQIHFVTLSVEEGIMLPANPLVKFLIKAALIRAYKHHPLDINHLLVNGTHMHMITRIENPLDLPKFMERFKTESAHYLNRILGRKKRTVWCARYDSPALLTKDAVMSKIAYLYTNPVKDGLIESINKYPGLSSWEHYRSNTPKMTCNYIRRDSLFEMTQDKGYSFFDKMRKLLIKDNPAKGYFEFNPNGWMKSFNITEVSEVNEINKAIKERINEIQGKIYEDKLDFMGRAKLENQGIDLSYRPKRSGRKMWCICENKALRRQFINFAKNLCEEANEIYQNILQGDFSELYPAGLFPPRLPYLHSLIEHRRL
jgi:REP element-mobilizing transposase RayT